MSDIKAKANIQVKADIQAEAETKNESPMMKQIKSIPDLMGWLRKDLADQAEQAAETIQAKNIRKIILTGCGDSYCAAMAARLAFLKYTGLEIEVTPVIELSRCYDRRRLTGEGDVLVVIVSNSGHVSRCIELAKRVRSFGGTLLGVTGKEGSDLYVNSSFVLKLDIPGFPYAPGIRSYTACIYALYLLAVSLGRRDGSLTTAAAGLLLNELQELEAVIDAGMNDWEQAAYQAAKYLLPCISYEWIGTGAGYVNGWFACAKLLETAGRPGGAYNTEDWFHMNYFIKDVEHTATILFTRANGKECSRADELITVAAEMGRPLLCITDRQADIAGNTANSGHIISVPGIKENLLSIFVDYIPAAMITAFAGELLQEVYFRDGKDRWTACVDFATVGNSRQVIEGGEG